ncbi:MAG: adenylate/guanylate cyclase domain-containing protein [Pseudomonadota bacterium]
MNDKVNKTSICSIVFLDIIDYSKKSVSEQIDIKNQFNRLINHSLKDVEPEDRIILDTGDGAAIAHMGSPEDALFISLSIRDEILKSNILSSMPLYVRFGINLGPVRVVRDINGQPNIIGDGINVAQRIMSFAKPNQIVVSRSYYEVTSRLTQEISQMFDYSGIKHDKHVREHEIYAVRLLKDTAPAEARIVQLAHIVEPAKQLLNPSNWFKNINWRYVALAMPALMTFAIVIKSAATPREPVITIEQSSVAKPATLEVIKDLEKAPQNDAQLLSNETLETGFVKVTEEKPLQIAVSDNAVLKQKPIVQAAVETKPMKKKTSKKSTEKTVNTLPVVINQNVDSEKQVKQPIKTAELTPSATSAKADSSNQKSGWKSFTDSLQQGQERVCTQAEVTMNQCHQ